MMKKNFIYSLCILLCGAIFMSSCEDMLEVDTDRVETDMSPLTLNDTVYSVVGILKKVQAVADRQVLLGELRGDLMVVNEGSAVDDIKAIANFNFDGNNKYLDVRDYYDIINNCNIYLWRVDTTLTYNNKKLMLREYVAVKSVRAWTYLQLATNYKKVPYFTEPILTHSLSEEISSRTPLGIEEIADSLIKDLAPYANSKQYLMPEFDLHGYKASFYFMPIRQLLGDLYLWKKDYRNAVDSYYNLILENKYVVNASGSNTAFWSSSTPKDDASPMGNYSPLSSFDASNTLALVGFSTSTNDGTVSDLPNVFIGDANVKGSHQVAAAPALTGLSKRQTYYHAVGAKKIATLTPNPNKYKPGDARLYNYLTDVSDNTTGIDYKGMIGKFGKTSYLSAIKIGRPVQAYLRLAEALAGLASIESNYTTSDGKECVSAWENADSVAMYILRYGLGTREFKNKQGYSEGQPELLTQIHIGLDEKFLRTKIQPGIYPIRKLVSEDKVQVYEKNEKGEFILDESGEKIPVYEKNEDGEKMPVYEIVKNYEVINLNFTNEAFKANMGIHAYGCGTVEWDESLSFDNDSLIAAYLGLPSELNPEPVYKKDETTGAYIIDETTGEPVLDHLDYGITQKERVAYLRNLILDECALETALEGYRFTDLIRFAEAMDDPDVLAKRVASRGFENKVNYYYNPEKDVVGEDGILLQFELDGDLYNKISNKDNWYLPLK